MTLTESDAGIGSSLKPYIKLFKSLAKMPFKLDPPRRVVRVGPLIEGRFGVWGAGLCVCDVDAVACWPGCCAAK